MDLSCIFKDFIYLFLARREERERERERNTNVREKHQSVAYHMPLAGDLAHNVVCALTRNGLQDNAQPTEPCHSGPELHFFNYSNCRAETELVSGCRFEVGRPVKRLLVIIQMGDDLRSDREEERNGQILDIIGLGN